MWRPLLGQRFQPIGMEPLCEHPIGSHWYSIREAYKTFFQGSVGNMAHGSACPTTGEVMANASCHEADSIVNCEVDKTYFVA